MEVKNRDFYELIVHTLSHTYKTTWPLYLSVVQASSSEQLTVVVIEKEFS